MSNELFILCFGVIAGIVIGLIKFLQENYILESCEKILRVTAEELFQLTRGTN